MREPNKNSVSVLLVDDAEVIRRAVNSLLEAEPKIKVLGEAANFKQAIEMANALKPDVVLLDLHMPDGYAFKPEFIKSQFALSGSKVLGMSLSSPDDEDANRTLAESFGAVAVLDKTRFGEELAPTLLGFVYAVACPSITGM